MVFFPDGKTENQAESSSSLVHSAITGSYMIEVFRDELSTRRIARRLSQVNRPASTRGMILGQSKKSRRRQMQTITRAENVERPVMVTFTYPDEVAFFGFDRSLTAENRQTVTEALALICADKDAVDCFKDSASDPPPSHQIMLDARFAIRKALRHAYPGSWWLYTVEWKKRLSGVFKGEYAPHMHYICFGAHDDLADMRKHIFRAWRNILQRLVPGVTLPRLRNELEAPRKNPALFKYLTKYITKEDCSEVRGWFEDRNIASTGRLWGRFGDYTAPVVGQVRMSYEEFILLRRSVSRWLQNTSRQYARKIKRSPIKQGFSVFGFGATVRDERLSVPDIPVWKLIEWCISATG